MEPPRAFWLLNERSEIVSRLMAELHFRDFESSAGFRFIGVFDELRKHAPAEEIVLRPRH